MKKQGVMFLRFILSSVLVLGIGVSLQTPVDARSKLGERHKESISHQAWSDLLNRYVREGFVDYRAWQRSAQDKARLEAYLAKLVGYPKSSYASLPVADRLALTLNLYNAAVIDLILKHYPVASINDIPVEGGKVFDKPLLSMAWHGSQLVSLNALENKIIRPTFEDSRIHFALVCAAQSCPPLLNEAYEPGSVDKQLEQQTRDFFNDKNHVFYSQSENVVRVSKIFQWYQGDFKSSAGSLKSYLYRELTKVKKRPAEENAVVDFFDYSWKLNQAR